MHGLQISLIAYSHMHARRVEKLKRRQKGELLFEEKLLDVEIARYRTLPSVQDLKKGSPRCLKALIELQGYLKD